MHQPYSLSHSEEVLPFSFEVAERIGCVEGDWLLGI